MNKVSILLLVVFLSILACKKDETTNFANSCSVNNPAQDLPWLREQVELINQQDLISDPFIKYRYIQQGDYRGETVFIFGNGCPFCNTVAYVYNCKGEIICTLHSKECPNLLEEIKNVKILTGR